MNTNSQNKNFYVSLRELHKLIGAMLEAQNDSPETQNDLPPTSPETTDPSIAFTMQLSDVKGKITDMMWKMVEVIGKSGASRYMEIEAPIKEQTPGFNKNKLRKAAELLVSMNVLHIECISTPLTSKCQLYSLTELGEQVFWYQFKEKPVQSEMSRVKREHHTLEHGYAILDLQKVLMNSGKFKEVCAFNRNNQKNAGAEHNYIPDLLCVSEDGKEEYFEYERGKMPTADFCWKCNKMRKTTSCLNFIARNKYVLENHLIPQLEDWISQCASDGPTDTVIRLTTAIELHRKNADDAWITFYNSKK